MKYVIFLLITLCSIQITFAQNGRFEKEASKIANSIDSISKAEKSALKKALAQIDKKLRKKEISEEQAKVEKTRLAEYHASKINDAIAKEELKLQSLVKAKADGTLKSFESKDYDGDFFLFELSESNLKKDSITGLKVEKRWTTQFIVALAAGMVTNDGGGFYGNGFKVNPLGYAEVGFTFKYRLKEDSALWNLKLGLSTMIDEVRPEADNTIFVNENGQTSLQETDFNLKRTRFANTYLAIPIHLEIDLSKPQFDSDTKQTYLRTQRGFRFGLGGFIGFRVFTSQFIRYNEGNERIRLHQDGNFNMNDIILGPSAYVGFRDFSLYVKYNANPMFRNNPQDIHNLSIGLRIDFN
ncbi:hypothetical protein [Winogradskyella sp.]|uniref:hypothetical protein n=1 Tax=Winogradskyella sp. TaxID=1883156 RepID=UPI00262EA588|nr:hypothetical protein [Winogradskyella sp.]